ncbi:MAG: nucleotidyltransferase family protein, partial [Planctomycetota bacterium]
SDYDQRYYRKWSHELPPLIHEQRRTVVDVHHTILPRTSRLKPDTEKLWAASIELDKNGLMVLGHQDMVLHSAAHLFQDGDLSFAIRDLVDLADLLSFFGEDPNFWESLVDRAYEHQLQRPLFYTLRYCQMLLDLNVPEKVDREISRAAPTKLLLGLMDRTVPRALLPDDPDGHTDNRANAATMLYLRSHWLRMPPWLLLAHLTRKSVMQFVASAKQKREENKINSNL